MSKPTLTSVTYVVRTNGSEGVKYVSTGNDSDLNALLQVRSLRKLGHQRTVMKSV